jgi:hypothetical protein
MSNNSTDHVLDILFNGNIPRRMQVFRPFSTISWLSASSFSLPAGISLTTPSAASRKRSLFQCLARLQLQMQRRVKSFKYKEGDGDMGSIDHAVQVARGIRSTDRGHSSRVGVDLIPVTSWQVA